MAEQNWPPACERPGCTNRGNPLSLQHGRLCDYHLEQVANAKTIAALQAQTAGVRLRPLSPS